MSRNFSLSVIFVFYTVQCPVDLFLWSWQVVSDNTIVNFLTSILWNSMTTIKLHKIWYMVFDYIMTYWPCLNVSLILSGNECVYNFESLEFVFARARENFLPEKSRQNNSLCSEAIDCFSCHKQAPWNCTRMLLMVIKHAQKVW